MRAWILLPLLAPFAGAQITNETLKLTASDAQAGDELGWSVAIDGNRILAGAHWDDDNGTMAGAAYVFDATTGAELHKLKPADGDGEDEFGFSVDLSGTLGVIGTPDDEVDGTFSGSVYLFDVATGAELMKLRPSDGAAMKFFGWSVAVDGNRIVVGAWGDGQTAAGAGAAYVFDTVGNELYKLRANDGALDDNFGWSVGISGVNVVVGSYFDDDQGQESGSAYVFDAASGAQLHKLLPTIGGAFEQFGVSIDVSGANVIVGSRKGGPIPGSFGEAYVFDATSGNETRVLIGANNFGESVAIDGTTALVGAFAQSPQGLLSGAAYLVDTATGSQIAALEPSDGAQLDLFSTAVAIDDTTAVVGAHNDAAPLANQGSVYVYGSPGAGGPLVYCTAKVSSAGCVASITTTSPAGQPVTGANDYSVLAQQVHEQKPGLMFASASGAIAAPFGGGILCVQPPLKRGPVLFSGGGDPNGCAGSFAQLVNDGIGFPNGFDPGAGNSIWCQFWLRDPANGAGLFGTALSNAVQLDFL